MCIMDILVVDLKSSNVERIPSQSELEGLEAGLYIHRIYGRDSLVLTATPERSVSSSSINTWSAVWTSPLLGHETFSSFNTLHGYSLYRLGIKAMVILNRSERMKYISLTSDTCTLVASENLRGSTSSYFEEIATSLSEYALSTGPAGDSGVKFASLQSGGKTMGGLDLGHIFFLHNLKGIVFPSFPDRRTGECNVPQKNVDKERYFKRIRTYGGYSFISDSLRLGWLPVRGWSDRFDPRAGSVDGIAMAEKYGSYPESCSECFLACDRRRKDGHILPQWKEIMTLGTNLGFFDSDDIDRIVSAVREVGLDPSVTGAMTAHILSSPEREKYGFRNGTVDEVVSFIRTLGSGTTLYNGLEDLPEAIQCQDHRPIDFDLRGASAMALSYSRGLGLFLGATLIFPKKRPNDEAAAIIAFYESIYSLALQAMGHPTFVSTLGYWSKVPEVAYQIPLVARYFARKFHAFSHGGEELMEKGMKILDSLEIHVWKPIPEKFLMDSVSKKGADTVSLKRLQDYWDREKNRVEILLKSRREKTEKDEASNKPKVGPEEERGLEAEPGLQ